MKLLEVITEQLDHVVGAGSYTFTLPPRSGPSVLGANLSGEQKVSNNLLKDRLQKERWLRHEMEEWQDSLGFWHH